MTEIILVRHGQTEWNRIERFRGRADIPLDETGLAQAALTGKRVAAEWKPAAVYSSPLSRALKTAEAAAGLLGMTVQVAQGLIDIDYGDWQGLTPDEARGRWPEAVSAWYDAPHRARIPGGEQLADLQARALDAIHSLSENHPDQTIVLVSHTVVNRVILLGLLGLGFDRFWELGQDTCAINVLELGSRGFRLVRWNDTCHMNDLA